jgi:hypothetical protein
MTCLFNSSCQLIPIILYYLDDEYHSLHPNLPTESIKNKEVLLQSLRIAETNGLLYPFCRRLLKEPFLKPSFGIIRAQLKSEERSLAHLRVTLQAVKALFEEESMEFMFIKLYRGEAYAPRDVDVLVKPAEMQSAISKFERNGFYIKTFSDVEIKCEKTGLLKVDLYSGFHYLSSSFIDEVSLWKNLRIVDVQGVDCPIPSIEMDYLSLMIHSLLGHRRLSLLDFLYAKGLLNSAYLSFSWMQREAEKCGWAFAFEKVSNKVNSLHESLYSSTSFPNEICFPFIFSTKFVLEIFQGFATLSIGRREKIIFVLSAFLDGLYHKYLNVWQDVPIAIPEQLKDAISRSLYEIRERRGDQKAVAEK